MSRKVLGIDIRNQSLTAVLLNSSLREHRVEDYLHLPFSAPDDPEMGLSTALETLAEKMDLAGSDYVVSIPAGHFTFRNLQVPFNNAKKIRMVLPFELEPTLPGAVEDLVIDFHTLNGPAAGDQTELVAAAIEKNQLTPYIEALASIKIDPERLTLSGLPTALCLANQADVEEDQLFIEIDEAHGTLFVLAGDRLQLIRSFPLPTANPARAERLCSQIQQTLAAFQESSGFNFEPLEVVVSGIGLDEDYMAAEITKTLDIPVKAASIADRLDIPVQSDIGRSWIPVQMDNALALALMEVEGFDGLNFHKGQFAAQKFLSKHKSPLIKTGILAAAVLALMFFNILMETYSINKQVRRINSQMTQIFKATFPEIKTIRYPYQEMQAKMRETKKNAVFQAETGPHIRRIDILNSISEKIPESITVNLTRLVIQPENVLISGTTDTFNAVDDIKSRLEQIQHFEKVTISSANMDRSGNEVRFMLKVEL
ncbi:MAG: type II secretion system protein GspL [Desulfobacterales bacterium]|jgi:type II secretion system protein L